MEETLTKKRAIPTFAPEHHPAFEQLRKYVRQLEHTDGRKAAMHMRMKAVLFPALYFGAYATALIFGNTPWILYTSYITMGFMMVFIFLNLIHDAVHNSLFESRALNKLFVHLFDLLGANSFVWSVRHRRLHHNFPNVMGWDSDIEQSDLARVFPHGTLQKRFRNQHIYLPLLYPLYLFNWLLIRDFKDYFNKNKPVWKVLDIPTSEYVKLFLFKALYLAMIIAVPIAILNISWMHVVGAFLVMMFSASIFSLAVLLSPHANTESEFPLADSNNRIAHTWFMHQLKCTNDVVHDNWFTRFCMASFNFHVIHHLFPTLNHYHYPKATAELQRLAVVHGLPYRSFPLWLTLRNHWLLLKRNGVEENIFEETM